MLSGWIASKTHRLGLSLVIGRVPLLGLLGVVRHLPSRLAELLAGGSRHFDDGVDLSSWGVEEWLTEGKKRKIKRRTEVSLSYLSTIWCLRGVERRGW